MKDGDLGPTRKENAWLTDEVVSSIQGPQAGSGRDREAIQPDRGDEYLRLQFVRIPVRDQERSMRFFVEQLGFQLLLDVRFASGNRWIEVAPPDGTASLSLVLPALGSDEETMIGKSGAVTFLAEDVEARYREWLKRGVPFAEVLQKPAWGGMFCRFEDPDGNSFLLAGFDDATRQIEARRRVYAAYLEASKRAQQELAIAKEVQSRLFPQYKPKLPMLDYAGVCVQALAVGGDYFDFLELSESCAALVIGDVAGKGIAAALLMANLQASLRSQHLFSGCRPDESLELVNGLLYRNSESACYATLFFAQFDRGSDRVRYANCGHVPAIVLRASGAVERLASTCTVLGLFRDWNCSISETFLNEGDVLALYTDGVSEAMNGAGEDFGESGLVDALQRNISRSAEELVDIVVREVVEFSGNVQQDDITLIVAKRIG
jgi:serine phosphatase RsbU (regulator of sigma subunit)/catechol 2,3-dioxygenase-like lactoylglutathione lyase family enzyme